MPLAEALQLYNLYNLYNLYSSTASTLYNPLQHPSARDLMDVVNSCRVARSYLKGQDTHTLKIGVRGTGDCS